MYPQCMYPWWMYPWRVSIIWIPYTYTVCWYVWSMYLWCMHVWCMSKMGTDERTDGRTESWILGVGWLLNSRITTYCIPMQLYRTQIKALIFSLIYQSLSQGDWKLISHCIPLKASTGADWGHGADIARSNGSCMPGQSQLFIDLNKYEPCRLVFFRFQ